MTLHFSDDWNQTFLTFDHAATLAGCTTKTIRRDAAHPEKADPARAALLRAHALRRIIPESVPVWFDPQSNVFCTATGYTIQPVELEQIGWYRHLYSNLEIENRRLKARLAELEAAPAAQPTGGNVIAFPRKPQQQDA